MKSLDTSGETVRKVKVVKESPKPKVVKNAFGETRDDRLVFEGLRKISSQQDNVPPRRTRRTTTVERMVGPTLPLPGPVTLVCLQTLITLEQVTHITLRPSPV